MLYWRWHKQFKKGIRPLSRTGTRDEPLRTYAWEANVPSPTGKIGRGDSLLFSRFFWGRGDVCTQANSWPILSYNSLRSICAFWVSTRLGYSGDRTEPNGNWSLRYKVVSIGVFSIRTQEVKLHKNIVHFKYSLRVNKKSILGEYFSFFKPSTSNYVHLNWKYLHRNDRYSTEHL